MHPQDGSSLPVDGQLRFAHNLPAFHKVHLLCRSQHVDSGLPPFQTDRTYLE